MIDIIYKRFIHEDLTFNLQTPGKYVSFIPVRVLNCPQAGD